MMYYTIGLETASQATVRGLCHKRVGVGFKLTIKLLPAWNLDHTAQADNIPLNIYLCIRVQDMIDIYQVYHEYTRHIRM
jgi:hypothetical protein